MKDFTVAMVQATFPQANSVDENIRTMDKWVRSAAREGAQFVMFGELCISGYLLDTTGMNRAGAGSSMHYLRAEAVPGAAVGKIEEIAKEYDVFIGAGMGDIQAGVVYNAYFLVGPGGYVGKQRKLHIPGPEYPYYGAGSEMPVFDVGMCKMGVSICFDNWFPETSRILALEGAEVLLAPWMWTIPPGASQQQRREYVENRRATHKKFFPARALDNAMYVLVLDHVGVEADGFELPGVSMAIDPMGDVICESRPFEEEIMIVHIRASEVVKARTYGHHYTLRFRRPELYGRLAQMVP